MSEDRVSNFLHAFQGLDLVHLIFFALIVALVLRSRYWPHFLSNLLDKKMRLGMGVADDPNIRAAHKKIDVHVDKCDSRYKEIHKELQDIKFNQADAKTHRAVVESDVRNIKDTLDKLWKIVSPQARATPDG